MENLIAGAEGVFAELRLGMGEGFVEGGSGAFRNDVSVMRTICGSEILDIKVKSMRC
jgi:hypothetical protein